MRAFSSLNLNKDFRRAYYHGKSFVTPSVVVYFSKNRENTCRMGITTSKKIGCAVRRNRARRVIRAAFDELYRNEKVIEGLKGKDVVIVARTRATNVKSTVVLEHLSDAFASYGLLPKSQPECD